MPFGSLLGLPRVNTAPDTESSLQDLCPKRVRQNASRTNNGTSQRNSIRAKYRKVSCIPLCRQRIWRLHNPTHLRKETTSYKETTSGSI